MDLWLLVVLACLGHLHAVVLCDYMNIISHSNHNCGIKSCFFLVLRDYFNVIVFCDEFNIGGVRDALLHDSPRLH